MKREYRNREVVVDRERVGDREAVRVSREELSVKGRSGEGVLCIDDERR